MKNINASAIALTLSLFAVGMSAADKGGKPTDAKPNVVSTTAGTQTGSAVNTPSDKTGFFASIKGFLGSAYASLASNSSDAWTYIKGHKVKSAIIGTAVAVATVAVVKNRKQIYKAIMNNKGKTAAAVAAGLVGLYGFNAGWFTGLFSSKATA